MVQRKEVVDETVRRHIVQRKYALLEGDEGIRNLRQNQLRMTLKYLKDKIALNRKNRGNVSIMQSTIINQDLKTNDEDNNNETNLLSSESFVLAHYKNKK